jgi:guanosine-diphosphatase
MQRTGDDQRQQHDIHPESPSASTSQSSVSPFSFDQHLLLRNHRGKNTNRMFRSGIYERLEGGISGSTSSWTGSRKFAWRKAALGAAVLIGLVWLFGPREPRGLLRGNTSKTPGQPFAHPPPTLSLIKLSVGTVNQRPIDNLGPLPPFPSKLPTGGLDSDLDHPIPTSPSNDPDRSKTTQCKTPHPSAPRLVQYALMIDAGSTGSRIHIYKFNHCGPSPMYEYEVFRMTQPGLSDYSGRPAEAAQSLDVLLDEALEVVPRSLHSCTPVAVKATAGLRLLGASQSTEILDAIRARFHSKYPFAVDDTNGVVIMDGKDEGVYAWITANYLLDTIRPGTPPQTPTYAVLDLGGASTQIVFEPTFAKPDSSLVDGEHKYELVFGGMTRVLYQHSYLGYGLMRARASVHRLVDFMASLRVSAERRGVVGNPCLARGTTKQVTIKDELSGRSHNVTMDGGDIGGFEACNRVVQLVMAKDA